MYIYIYGSEKFKIEVNKLLKKANINDNIEYIKTPIVLKSTIKDSPNEIFLIDNDKIIDDTVLLDKLNFLKPKDGINKSFLNKYGVGDICFNSMNGLVDYISFRLNATIVTASSNEKDAEDVCLIDDHGVEFKDDYSEEQITEKRDSANILLIEDIFPHEMTEAMVGFADKTELTQEKGIVNG